MCPIYSPGKMNREKPPLALEHHGQLQSCRLAVRHYHQHTLYGLGIQCICYLAIVCSLCPAQILHICYHDIPHTSHILYALCGNGSA